MGRCGTRASSHRAIEVGAQHRNGRRAENSRGGGDAFAQIVPCGEVGNPYGKPHIHGRGGRRIEPEPEPGYGHENGDVNGHEPEPGYVDEHANEQILLAYVLVCVPVLDPFF